MRWPGLVLACSVGALVGSTQAPVVGCALLLPPGPYSRFASAQDEGTADLEKATELKLNAASLRDLEQVIRLCESAKQKGLSDDSQKFADQLLTGTLLEVAQQLTGPILKPGEPDPRWPFLRRQALLRLDRVLELDDSMTEAHLLRAQLLALPEGDKEEAQKSLDRAMELLKDNPRDLSRCYQIGASLKETPEAQLELLNKAIELDGSNADALRARAVMYLLTQKTDDALADFQRLAELDAGDVTAQQAIAELLVNNEKFEEALAAINQAIAANPEAAASYLVRARIHMAKEQKEEALADLSKGIELDPENIQALLMRAEFYMQEERFDEARGDVDQALLVRPGLIRAILLRSLIRAGKSDFTGAAEDLELLVANDPSNTPFQLQLALMYNAGERPHQAIELYNKILKNDPKSLAALRGRGDCYLTTGDHEAAIKDYNASLEIEGDDDHVLNNLAWVLATSTRDEVRDGKRSVELGLRACELTEYKEAHILSTLAAGYAEIGEWEKAIEFSTKAVENARDEENRANLQKELESYQRKEPWRERQERMDQEVKPDDTDF